VTKCHRRPFAARGDREEGRGGHVYLGGGGGGWGEGGVWLCGGVLGGPTAEFKALGEDAVLDEHLWHRHQWSGSGAWQAPMDSVGRERKAGESQSALEAVTTIERR
jgi:hypothetical protein